MKRAPWLLTLVSLLAGFAAPLTAAPPVSTQWGDVPVYRLPAIDNAELVVEDALAAAPGIAPRFALPVAVKIDPYSQGDWQTLADGTMQWRLRVVSPGAKNLNFGFTRFRMPQGGALRIYSADKGQSIRPFTAADNKPHGELWTPILETDDAILEVTLPAAGFRALELELTQIGHGYRTFGEVLESGSCNVDVICPEGDDWRDEIRSVAVYGTGGSTFCTGFMVNNTAQDLRPLFMTANHCGIAGSAASLVVYWNYENSVCRAPGSPASGGAGNGSLSQFQTGATLLATYSPSDFTIVELDSAPDEAWNVHWAGWDRTSSDFAGAIAIHHPNTDEKRISFENDPTSTTTYLQNTVPGDGTHVRIEDWDLGTTEPGSSGSPLFNPAHRVIGQLHGGFASCSSQTSDWYGRLSVSWNGGGSSNNRLSDHLDPTSSGAMVLDGRDTSAIAVAPALVEVCAPDDGVFDVTVSEIGGMPDMVTLSASGVPAGASTGFSVNPVSPPGMSTMTISNTGAASAGSYMIEVAGSAGGGTETDIATLAIFAGAPSAPTLTAPVNGALNQSQRPTFTWSAPANTAQYLIEIATDAGFGNIVASAMVTAPTFTPGSDLASDTQHYWRVTPSNPCGDGTTSATYTFTTQPAPGDCSMGTTANIVFQDDMESGAAGWTHSGTGDTWALSTVRANSGTMSYHATDVATVSDQYLVTPAVVLPAGGGLSLQFYNYQEIEDSGSGCFDGGVLEVSTDGVMWTRLEAELQTDPYDGAVSTSFSSPIAGENAWCGDPQDWLESVVDINAWAGQTVQFRWRLATDSSASREGWYIDDVVVQSCEGGPGGAIFSDGFESGNTSAWSLVVP
jgi:hypothetical protein